MAALSEIARFACLVRGSIPLTPRFFRGRVLEMVELSGILRGL